MPPPMTTARAWVVRRPPWSRSAEYGTLRRGRGAADAAPREEAAMGRSTTTAVDVTRYRGRFFEVLQQTERSQTAVMTIAPGEEAGPEETHAGDQILFVL